MRHKEAGCGTNRTASIASATVYSTSSLKDPTLSLEKGYVKCIFSIASNRPIEPQPLPRLRHSTVTMLFEWLSA
ncbi:hypothetical protein BN844_3356 [Pseudomonas sp. SHC52]|nr:hypothetical protein BN844_3356 [Pseudomonas sp. SHC52]